MAEQVALDDLIDGLDIQTDGLSAYLDRSTGAVLTIDDQIVTLSPRDEPDEWADWERDQIEVLREIEKGSTRYVQLPTKRDVHEWNIMRRYCDNVEDERLRQLLLQTTHARGAFRRFRDELDRALREHAIAWCAENEIPFR